MINALKLDDILAVQHVHRWHMIKVRRTQNLAEHTCLVSLIAAKMASVLSEPLAIEDYAMLLELALTHDIYEIEYGDIPTPTKRVLREAGHGEVLDTLEKAFWESRGSLYTPRTFTDAPERVHNLIKLADLMEAAIFYTTEGDDVQIKRRLSKDALLHAQKHFPNDPNLMQLVTRVIFPGEE